MNAVGTRAVPRHADEQRPVMAEVRRPPRLRRRHHRLDVFLDGLQVERLELLGVIEPVAHRVGCGRVHVEDAQVELIRPPVAVRHSAVCFGRERAFLFVVHVTLTSNLDRTRRQVRSKRRLRESISYWPLEIDSRSRTETLRYTP